MHAPSIRNPEPSNLNSKLLILQTLPRQKLLPISRQPNLHHLLELLPRLLCATNSTRYIAVVGIINTLTRKVSEGPKEVQKILRSTLGALLIKHRAAPQLQALHGSPSPGRGGKGGWGSLVLRTMPV